jgi:hypothetical protein
MTTFFSRVVKVLKKILKMLLPGMFYYFFKYCRSLRLRERKKSFGNLFPDKTFYIIRRLPPGAGLFSNFHYVLDHIYCAFEKGYIPVVDMKNYRTSYTEKHPMNGTLNAWEYYFEQPTDYTMEDAYKGKNVVLSSLKSLERQIPSPYQAYMFNDKNAIQSHYNCISQYMRFRPEVMNIINKQQNLLFNGRTKILGVMSRGSDYNVYRSYLHSILPSSAWLCKKSKELFDEWGMEHVFLTTEEAFVVDEFEKTFGERLIVTERERLVNYNNQLLTPEIRYNRENDKYFSGLEYITDIVLLSRCDAIICPMVTGSVAAVELNNNRYTHRYIIDFGFNRHDGA